MCPFSSTGALDSCSPSCLRRCAVSLVEAQPFVMPCAGSDRIGARDRPYNLAFWDSTRAFVSGFYEGGSDIGASFPSNQCSISAMLTTLVVLLLACFSVIDSASAGGALRFRRKLSPNVYFPKCSCSCCNVGIPLLRSSGGNMKCFPPMNSCPMNCKSKDSIISTARKNNLGDRLLEYKRFCYLECKPPSCEAGSGTRCIPLSPSEVSSAKVLNGNGKATDLGCK